MAERRALRILVVEDERIVAMDIEAGLKAAAYEVLQICDSGEEAVRLAKTLKPDLVLMDILLKGQMTGVEAAEVIGKELQIPIVYVTAHSDEASLELVRQTKYYGYLLKPFGRKDLYDEMDRALKKWDLEGKLMASRSLNQHFMNASSKAWLVVDEDAAILGINAAAESFFGFRSDEVLGRNFADIFVPGTFREKQHQALLNLFENGAAKLSHHRLEMPLCDKKGQSFSVQLEIFTSGSDIDSEYFILCSMATNS